MEFEFKSVKRIVNADGSSAKLASELDRLRVCKPLIVTDAGIVAAGLLDGALASLRDRELTYELFTEVQADPADTVVRAAVDLAVSCGCDSVVGLGGGSSMDVAKLVAVLLLGQQSLEQCYGVDQILGMRAPLIQVPTTAGTGSEVTSVAIVTTGATTKSGVVSDVLYADTVLLDAGLTIGLPSAVTAATGVDAMVHAIEAFTSRHKKNPISDMLARQALILLSANISTAVKEGSNVQAREAMLLGAMFAGQAFSNAPVAAVHALAYPLGGIYHVPHGLSNSLVLPHVLRFNAPAADHSYQELLPCFRLSASAGSAAETLAEYFLELAENLGLPSRLQQIGIAQSSLPELAEQAMLQQRLLINNPRDVSQADALYVYQQAF